MFQLCSRCKIRPAVVFITKVENNESKPTGLCLQCARELKVGPIEQIIKQTGLSDEELDSMMQGMQDMISEMGEDAVEGLVSAEDGPDATGAPAMDLRHLFSGAENSGGTTDKKSKSDTKAKEKERRHLSQFCIDLTSRAREGKLDRIVGRDKELERVVQILCRRQKNNPCLIGEPGVGKTALAEALAQRIVDGNVPFKLKGREVHLVDMTTLVAGTQFRGQFENRMRGLIDEVKKLGNIILVIDEVHTIVGAGDAEGGMNAANILKPALSRGEIQMIGATTLSEYRKYIEKDAALERRFQPVMVNEPSIADTVRVLAGIKKYYEEFHGLSVPEDILERTVLLSERYITDRFLPDKAIDLLDEACAKKALSSPVVNRLGELSESLDRLREQREALEALTEPTEDVYSRIADVKVQEIKNRNEYDSLTLERQNIRLTENDLAEVIEIWTGIPAGSIAENDFHKLETLSDKLKERIIGQDKAVDAVARAIKRSRVGIAYKRRPVSFIFAGPTGVGKTELVKTLAGILFDSPESLIRLDMSEFMEKHSVSRIIGSPPGYVGYDDAGQLTEKIRRKPYSVVLFDEIEKAHPDVMNILLQILDDGVISDAHGKQVNFENTVLIMTTNAGSSLGMNTTGFLATSSAMEQTRTEKALSEFLRPEFLNRVDEIITFNKLGVEEMKSIARLRLDELSRVLSGKGIVFSIDSAAVEYVAVKSFSEKYGARNLNRFIQTEIEDKIAESMIASWEKGLTRVSVVLENESLTVRCE